MWTKPCRKPWKWMLDNFFWMLLPFSSHSLSHYFYTAFLFFGACSEGFLLHDILCFLLILIKMYIHTHNRIIVADTLQISHFTSQWCRIIVPPEIGYPENDYNKSGPRPTTFSGQRALDFVLRNQGLIDKTLLFDIELLKIIPNWSFVTLLCFISPIWT